MGAFKGFFCRGLTHLRFWWAINFIITFGAGICLHYASYEIGHLDYFLASENAGSSQRSHQCSLFVAFRADQAAGKTLGLLNCC